MIQIRKLAGLGLAPLAGDDESGPIDRKVRWILSARARSQIQSDPAETLDFKNKVTRS
jgi:hypothetical protein